MKHIITLLTFCFIIFFSAAHHGFEKNIGQVMDVDRSMNKDVLYIFNQKNFQITLRKNGFSYSLKSCDTSGLSKKILKGDTNFKIDIGTERIDFIFPKKPLDIISDGSLQSKKRYSNENGSFQPQIYKRILYKEVTDGFDIEFIIENNHFKYNIIKSSIGQLENFYLKVKTAGDLKLVNDNLQINTKKGRVSEHIPKSYLGMDKNPIAVRFLLEGNTLRFISKESTDGQSLIIDPVPDLVWSSFVGGEEFDLTTSTLISEDGCIYSTGITSSLTNISTSGAFQTNFQGDLDIFISKLSKDGDLKWSSYYGGPQSERIYSITEDNGFIYLAGSTFSTIGMVTPGAHQSSIVGADDIFLLKMDENGNRIWCTYHGGNDHDFITDILVQNDTLFMAGHTRSLNNIATSGVHLETYSANEAGHITLFKTNGDFLWGTYFGTEGSTSIQGITKANNKIFVTGRTNASNGISTLGTHQEIFGGYSDAFIATFENDGTLLWSTYFGGDYADAASAIAKDTSGGVFVAGNTSSLNQISTAGAHQETRLSPEHGFIAHFDKNGMLKWATYAGGSSTDYITALCSTDSAIYIGGQTLSNDEIATIDTYQSAKASNYDGFIQRFDYNGNLIWGSYLGGTGNEDIFSISSISSNLIIAGSVDQDDPIFGQGNSNSTHYGGGTSDGFLVYLCQPSPSIITLVGDSLVSSSAENVDWYFEGNSIASDQQSIHPENDGNYTVISSVNGKCPIESDAFYFSTIGTHEDSTIENSDILLYPNPTSGIVKIEKNGTFSGFITTIEGKKINIFEAEEFITLNISNLKSGTYLIHLYDQTNYFIKKIIRH